MNSRTVGASIAYAGFSDWTLSASVSGTKTDNQENEGVLGLGVVYSW